MQSESGDDHVEWIFAYGSLIWRPGFDSSTVQPARLGGYERRFWQASHDHRGTPDLPGRVVTLAPIADGHCDGLAYQLPKEQRQQVLQALDHREQDGYQRAWVELTVSNTRRVSALTWIAFAGNPSWAGDQPLAQIAQLIAERRGPSGSNQEYLQRLHKALDELGIHDSHVMELHRWVEGLCA